MRCLCGGAVWFGEIANLATGKQTLFPCGKWLDKGKGDGELYKELYPAKEQIK